MARVTHVAIIGGGPGGYEAALVAAQLDAQVTVVDTDGLGGSAVLTDCVPSKTLIATAEVMTQTEVAGELFTPSSGVGVVVRVEEPDRPCVRASNDHGDVTEWACVDLEDPPVDPDPEDVDLAVAQGS